MKDISYPVSIKEKLLDWKERFLSGEIEVCGSKRC
jgi:hypothetical protein